jgi:hypothetical protein
MSAGDTYRIRVFPLLEAMDGLTAEPGPMCAFAEHVELGEAMAQAGRDAAAWIEHHGDPRPIALDVRVEVPN